VPGARLHGICVSLHNALISGAFPGRRFLRLQIPDRGRGSNRSGYGRRRSLAERRMGRGIYLLDIHCFLS